MNDLMTSNVYLPEGNILISGSCLGQMFPAEFEALCREHDSVWLLCLEQTHINMAITKISAILGTGKVSGITFASVDRSPHCTQLHYIKHEIERTMPVHCPFRNVVVCDKGVITLSDRAVELSKSLAYLNELDD